MEVALHGFANLDIFKLYFVAEGNGLAQVFLGAATLRVTKVPFKDGERFLLVDRDD
jgi:hypothetical protein